MPSTLTTVQKPRISIFGLGYVGAVSAGCFAERGHTVVGVDVSAPKVATLAAGKSPILEKGLEDLLSKHVKTGRLTATTDAAHAVVATDISIICVGTPSSADGTPDVSSVINVCEQIGAALKDKRERHTVVLRSTTLPWMAQQLFLPTLEGSSGNDTLYAGDGVDKLYGQSGDDTLYARKPSTSTLADNDVLDGGIGTDKAQVDSTDSKTGVETLMA